MKRPFLRAFNELKKLGCPMFERSDYEGGFFISAEDAASDDWADYYAFVTSKWDGENISPKLREVLDKYKLYAEWENPGCLIVLQN